MLLVNRSVFLFCKYYSLPQLTTTSVKIGESKHEARLTRTSNLGSGSLGRNGRTELTERVKWKNDDSKLLLQSRMIKIIIIYRRVVSKSQNLHHKSTTSQSLIINHDHEISIFVFTQR
jgi:hypothetical protein